jgi:hypothetical protein
MKKLNKPLNLNKNFEFLIKLTLFFVILSWFIFNYFVSFDLYSDIFAVLLSIIALFGFLITLKTSFDWGFTKSLIGLSLVFISFGMLMWFLGQSFYFYDSKSENPLEIYEFFFILIDPFYLLGLYFLAQAIGTFKYLRSNFSLLILPVLILIFNFLIVSFLNNLDPIELILNFNIENLYIFGSIILATFVVSILIFSKKLGGIYKTALYLMLLGVLFQFIGDNLYAFLESQQTNGSLADLLFFVSVSFVTLGVYKLDSKNLNE